MCSVSSAIAPLTVVWQWTGRQSAGPIQEVASVDRDGTVTHGPSYRERSGYGEIRVERVRADIFSLSLYNALPGDEGQYRCSATQWINIGTETDPNWEKLGEQSATKTVTVKTVGKLYHISLDSPPQMLCTWKLEYYWKSSIYFCNSFQKVKLQAMLLPLMELLMKNTNNQCMLLFIRLPVFNLLVLFNKCTYIG